MTPSARLAVAPSNCGQHLQAALADRTPQRVIFLCQKQPKPSSLPRVLLLFGE